MKALWLLALTLTGQAGGTAGLSREDSSDVLCGAKALYVALKALDLAPPSFDALRVELGEPDPKGYSVAELETVARRRGAKTLAVSTSLDRLRRRPEGFACITLSNREHFAVLYDVDEDEVYLVDPPNRHRVPRKVFETQWDGVALLLSARELTAEEALNQENSLGRWAGVGAGFGGVLVFAGLVWNGVRKWSRRRLGCVIACVGLFGSGCGSGDPSLELSKVIAWRIEPGRLELGEVFTSDHERDIPVSGRLVNLGDRPLTVLDVESSCGCTSVRVNPTVIPPGSQAQIVATLKLEDDGRPKAVQVSIHTDDPRHRTQQWEIEWSVRSRLSASPAELDLGRIAPSAHAKREIQLIRNDEPFCAECRITTESSHSQLVCRTVSDDRSSGEYRLLALEAQANDLTTKRAEWLNVEVRCRNERVGRLRIPVSWTTGSAFRTIPERIFLGRVARGTDVRQGLLIMDEEGRPLSIDSVTAKDCVDFAASTTATGARARVDLSLKTPSKVGPWRTHLEIVANDGSCRINVPISAMVE